MDDGPRVALVVKRSAYARAMDRPDDRMHMLLERGDPTVANVMASHEEHSETVKEVKAALNESGAKAIRMRRLDFDDADLDLVVTVGGDGTLLRASHNLGDTPVLGINSAPSSSVGFFCGARKGEVLPAIREALAGKLRRTELNRMQVAINGKVVHARVLNDALFCHQSPAATSRYIICYDGIEEEQKSSGFWIGPAAGSTAAQRSAGGEVLPFSSKQLQLVVREPYSASGAPHQLAHVLVEDGRSIDVRSKARNMRLYLDGPDRMERVGLGDVVAFSSSPEPLQLLGVSSRRSKKDR